MIQFACYKGTSWVSKAIRFVTRSEYSHVALLFTREYVYGTPDSQKIIPAGGAVEAWQESIWRKGAVRVIQNLSDGHSPGTKVDIFTFTTPMWPEEFNKGAEWLVSHIGDPYDFKGVLRFVTRRPGKEDDAWFCSELAFDFSVIMSRKLFERTEGWEVPPDMPPRSTLLKYDRTEITV